MSDIRSVLRRAGFRLMLTAFLRHGVLALTAAIAAAIVLRILSVVLGFGVLWDQVAIWGGVGALVATLIWTIIAAPKSQAIARRVDEGADLKETLSTALSVAGSPDAWCKAVIDTASAKARTVNVARAVPVTAPRTWPAPLTAALTLVVVWFLPMPRDVLGKQARAQEEQKQQQETAIAKAESKAAEAKVEELLKKLDPNAGQDPEASKPEEAEKPKEQKPEEIRKSAIKKLEGMKDKLEQLKSDSEKAQTAEALKDMLKQLRNQPGPLEDMVKALAKGDFKAAQEELAKMDQKMASGEMSQEQKQAMAKQLESMKNQLEKLAQSKKDLEEKLKQAGLDSKLASDPEALKKALEKNSELSEQQKEQISKMAQAKQNASESCQGMAQSMNKMAKSMQQGGQEGEQGEKSEQGQQQASQELAQQLSDMEMMQAEAQQMDAAMSECQAQLKQLAEGMGQCNNPGMGECEGGLQNKPWSAGDTQKQGGRNRGGPGQGQGGSASEQPADENWTKRNFKSKTGQGPIIGSTMIQGEQVKGESRAQFEDAVNSGENKFSEALESKTIPREFHDVIKSYFGDLKKKTQSIQAAKDAQPKDQEADNDKDAKKDAKKNDGKK